LSSPLKAAEGIPSHSWADLFGVSVNNRLEYVEPDVVDGFLRMPKEVREEGVERWKHCLVGQFLGAPPPLAAIQGWATRLWGRRGQVLVSRKKEKEKVDEVVAVEVGTKAASTASPVQSPKAAVSSSVQSPKAAATSSVQSPKAAASSSVQSPQAADPSSNSVTPTAERNSMVEGSSSGGEFQQVTKGRKLSIAPPIPTDFKSGNKFDSLLHIEEGGNVDVESGVGLVVIPELVA
ncbi:hypothetical protein LINPERPRIM_LOCUS30760, partial [Linum perenne]